MHDEKRKGTGEAKNGEPFFAGPEVLVIFESILLVQGEYRKNRRSARGEDQLVANRVEVMISH